MITFFSALDKTNSTDPAASLTGTKKKRKKEMVSNYSTGLLLSKPEGVFM